jgi:hypothetical protein
MTTSHPHRAWWAALLALAASCASPAPPTPAGLVGEWARVEDALPPIHLTVVDEGQTLGARLRLSGRDARGTATLDGSRLQLSLDGGASQIDGELISDSELRLRFGPRVYTLRRVRSDVTAAQGATDGHVRAVVEPDALRVTNLTNGPIAFTVYDRMRLAVRSSTIDPCMESPAAQCLSIAVGATRRVPFDAAIDWSERSAELAVRYWPAESPSSYPENARVLVVPLR